MQEICPLWQAVVHKIRALWGEEGEGGRGIIDVCHTSSDGGGGGVEGVERPLPRDILTFMVH